MFPCVTTQLICTMDLEQMKKARRTLARHSLVLKLKLLWRGSRGKPSAEQLLKVLDRRLARKIAEAQRHRAASKELGPPRTSTAGGLALSPVASGVVEGANTPELENWCPHAGQ